MADYSVQITVKNSPGSALERGIYSLASGDWIVQPAWTIAANDSATFHARPNAGLTEGSVTYRVARSGAEFTINFSCAVEGDVARSSVFVMPSDVARVEGPTGAPIRATVQVL